MVTVKAISGSYDDQRACANVINYIFQYYKTPNDLIGGYGAIVTTTNQCVECFEIVKNIFNKQDGRQLKHIIISFERNFNDLNAIYEMAFDFARFFANDYQVVFAVHEDKPCYHIHLVINSVSFKDGRMLDYNYVMDKKFKEFVNTICFMRELKEEQKMELA